MSLCRSFANPPVACLVRDKCRCGFFAIIGHNTNVAVVRKSVVSIIYYFLLLLVPVLKRRSTTHKSTSYNFGYNFVIASLEI